MPQQDILSFIGNTPLVPINRLSPNPGVKIMAKIESRNPGGSIKDRVALSMIQAAEVSGELTPGKTVIEATSGNTGIGLAMVCAVRGYKLKLLMPASASEERKRIMTAYGAEIMLTPGHLGTDGAIEEAYRLAREEPDKYVLMDQFNNPASIAAHYNGTAVEMWEQSGGALTHFVASLGTSGTAMGITKRLKEYSPSVCAVAVEPYPGHKIQGLKNMRESYPPGIYDKKVLDLILNIDDETAFETCRRLAREEGIFAGMSSGAAVAGALKLASEMETGYIVVIIPDGGERYLSTTLFAQASARGVSVSDLKSGGRVLLPLAASRTRLFTFGPSLDQPGDVETWRRVVWADLIARYLKANGAQTEVVAGLADFDDRAVLAASAAGGRREAFVEKAVAEVNAVARLLGVGPDVAFVRASPDWEKLSGVARRLLTKGLAYEKLRSVYFDVDRDQDYGVLAKVDPAKLSLGKTVDLDDYAKESPRDFTLLKRTNLRDLKTGDFVKTEWGNVRPSWYLQMAVAGATGSGPDVVLAGNVHRFPHLDNLRSVWKYGCGFEPKAWLLFQPVKTGHGESDADIRTLGLDGRILRLFLLSASGHKALSLSESSLSMWSKNWQRLNEATAVLTACAAAGRPGDVPVDLARTLADLESGLAMALEDDLSLHRFWPDLLAFCREVARTARKSGMTSAAAKSCLETLKRLDSVLGVFAPVESGASVESGVGEDACPAVVLDCLRRREEARHGKDFALADALRQEMLAAGYRVEDTAQGPRLHKV